MAASVEVWADGFGLWHAKATMSKDDVRGTAGAYRACRKAIQGALIEHGLCDSSYLPGLQVVARDSVNRTIEYKEADK